MSPRSGITPVSRRLAGLIRFGLPVTCLIATAGCRGVDGSTLPLPPPPPATIHDHWPGCRAVKEDGFRTGQPPPGGSVPTGFRPTTVIWCVSSQQVEPAGPDGADHELERRAPLTTGLSAYLALPSRRTAPGNNLACPAVAIAPTWLFLLNAKKAWITPQIPSGECGFPLPGPDARLLPWATLAYSDRIVCTYQLNRDASQTCR